MLRIIGRVLAKLPWKRLLWLVVYVFSKKTADLFLEMYNCVSITEASYPDASGEEKRRMALECIKEVFKQKPYPGYSDSDINLLLEIAVKALKLFFPIKAK